MICTHLSRRSTTSTRPSRRGAQETRGAARHHLDIDKGEYVSIIGHSGCGKSTLLNIVAGLTTVTPGAVLLENQEVNEPGPDRAVVFQNHSLLPWLTVYDNVRLAVDKVFGAHQDAGRAPRLDDAQSRARADGARQGQAPVGDLGRHEAARRHRPRARHGAEGAAARRAVRRARRADPRASAGQVMAIHERLGNTVLMITHDVDEAVLLSDRIVMMTNGPAARIGEVLEVPLARPRKRLELVAERRLYPLPRSACSSSCTRATGRRRLQAAE